MNGMRANVSKAVARGNVPLDSPAPGMIDAVQLRPGDKVLLTSQWRTDENGVYVVLRRRWWQRRRPLRRVRVLSPNVRIHAEEGAAYADTDWVQHRVDGETWCWTRFAPMPERAPSDIP